MEVTLDIKDKSKVPFLMELLKSLDYVRIVKEVKTEGKSEIISGLKKSKVNVLDNIRAGLEEVCLFNKGELKTTPAKDFLDEI